MLHKVLEQLEEAARSFAKSRKMTWDVKNGERTVQDAIKLLRDVLTHEPRLEGCPCNCHVMPFTEPHADCLTCVQALIAEADDLGWREGLERAALWCESRRVLSSEFYAHSIRGLKR